MDLKVFWTQFAEDKLDDIFDYYLSEVDIPTASKIVTGIIDKTILLKSNPFLGQLEELLVERPQKFSY